jgi:hypothetical protein
MLLQVPPWHAAGLVAATLRRGSLPVRCCSSAGVTASQCRLLSLLHTQQYHECMRSSTSSRMYQRICLLVLPLCCAHGCPAVTLLLYLAVPLSRYLELSQLHMSHVTCFASLRRVSACLCVFTAARCLALMWVVRSCTGCTSGCWAHMQQQRWLRQQARWQENSWLHMA